MVTGKKAKMISLRERSNLDRWNSRKGRDCSMWPLGNKRLYPGEEENTVFFIFQGSKKSQGLSSSLVVASSLVT